ncbi:MULTISPECIES: SPOR domain-containing protein [unclassified Sphingomonas]|uniref:SPOR domain-containing protein n=1 Tax=unclassified Sphingomonas TaxID=196159 RepID=UPI0006F4BA52|nr:MULTISPECIES: SPOR domain-containing protein [unclassified Sphingomonas]KQX18488.1 hypothetical protein ASD17_15145 [Sphingomonas sp. Root1294]KQY72186.1 hypothetical protein ASD39_19830 [Sphingomonas sp. Root50]KRB94539.1 hypothetical protein ASE22_00920 [Sphingomonas sp. Root720]
MKMNWNGLTATALGLALVSGAVAAVAAPDRGGSTAAAQKRADRRMAGAREAMARGVPAAAVRQAEAAVIQAPRDPQARAMLGRAYLAAGRFQSAETALGDALALDPTLVRVAINRALAQIALGRADEAATALDALRGTGNDADVGLALALLGRPDEARPLLLAAARAPGADARVRQNLAFALALEGRWNEAATIAAQDVPLDLVADRLRRWAAVGQLRADPARQVGAMLGVLPVADGGQPAALALVAEPASRAPVLLAQVAPPPAPPLPFVVPPPVLLPVEAQAPVLPAVIPVVMAGEPRIAAFAGPPVMRLGRSVTQQRGQARPRPAIVPAEGPIMLVSRGVKDRSPAKWVVQIGAYSTPVRTEIAWTALSRRAAFLADYTPTGSGFRHRGAMLHRLSIGGLASRTQAHRLCGRIRAVGGHCFIRTDGGDRPMQWTLRTRIVEPA